MAEVNLWGEVGLNFGGGTFQRNGSTDWVYAFWDQSTNPQNKQQRLSTREVTTSAECVEYEVTFGGYGNFDSPSAEDTNVVRYIDPSDGLEYQITVENVAIGSTTWIGNQSSVEESSCGPRCAQFFALQSANNCTAELATDPDSRCSTDVNVENPRFWSCTNTVGQVSNVNSSIEGFDNSSALLLPDLQAQVIAGGAGWSGVTIDDLQQGVIFRGQNIMNAPGNTTAEGMAQLVEQFSAGILSAWDGNGDRQNLTGANSPGPAQVVAVKWMYASVILIGIPLIQFIMLLGVVWFSGKAIILEPSYLAAAHLLQPVLSRVGEAGPLLSVNEMAEKLGDYKIAYGVRPDAADPGHSDTTFVRDLDVIEEREGFGYIRGKMPEGRYD